jgi:hypothetical protein
MFLISYIPLCWYSLFLNFSIDFYHPSFLPSHVILHFVPQFSTIHFPFSVFFSYFLSLLHGSFGLAVYNCKFCKVHCWYKADKSKVLFQNTFYVPASLSSSVWACVRTQALTHICIMPLEVEMFYIIILLKLSENVTYLKLTVQTSSYISHTTILFYISRNVYEVHNSFRDVVSLIPTRKDVALLNCTSSTAADGWLSGFLLVAWLVIWLNTKSVTQLFSYFTFQSLIT